MSLMGFRLVPKLSWDLEYLPHGSQLYVRRGAIGHLPLAGPWRRPLVKRAHATAQALPHWSVWTRNIQELKSGAGTLTLTVAR